MAQDIFGPYEGYLHRHVWPSVDYEGGPVSETPVFADDAKGGMAPQHAAASLAKLVRWAVHQPSGHLLMVSDVTQREQEVRDSELGMALVARAANLRSVEEFEALYRYEHRRVEGSVFHADGQVIQVDPTALVADVAVAISDQHSSEDLRVAIKWAARCVEALTKLGFRVTWVG